MFTVKSNMKICYTRFTLLIHTRNRPEFLLRLLDFHEKNNHLFGTKIIIADASEPEIYLTIKEGIAQRKYSLNIELLHHSPLVSFTQRLIDAKNMISTPYVLLAADDDLYLFVEWLEPAVSLLDNDSQFGAVYGQTIRFKLDSYKPYGKLVGFGLSKRIPPERWLEGDSAIGRLKELGKSDWATVGWYALQRVETLNSILVKAEKYKLEGYYLEKFLVICQTILVKTRMLDNVFLARQDEDYIREPYSYNSLNTSLQDFKTASSEVLAMHDNIELSEAHEIIDDVFQCELEELKIADSRRLARKLIRRFQIVDTIRNILKKISGKDNKNVYLSLRDRRLPVEAELSNEHSFVVSIRNLVESVHIKQK